MKFFIENAIFVNRAPFKNMELEFHENEISVLSAVNGKGKTTILSHIVDAFYEFARPHFQGEFEGRENKYYRISSHLFSTDADKPSLVYLRFRFGGEKLDYLDIRGEILEDHYNEVITLEDKIPFASFKKEVAKSKAEKVISGNYDLDKAVALFGNNLTTYFPSYRFENPYYLNDPYRVELEFKKKSGFSGRLVNPIEVVTGLNSIANWLLDVVLDLELYEHESTVSLFENVLKVVSNTVSSKGYVNARLGIGQRGRGATRIQITDKETGNPIYPSIFNMSSGEHAVFCMFCELIRQADNIKNNLNLSDVTGLVLIDEVDKHLHIRLQKEVLPLMFKLFPKVQFLISSHAPFLSIGLAETAAERSKIIDLDTFGISMDPTSNELYQEVYQMMVHENERFRDQYESLKTEIKNGIRPLIVTEGKTDVAHLKTALQRLNINGCDVDFFESPDGNWGDSKLESLLEHLSKVQQGRKVIGVFDRDVVKVVDEIERDGRPFKSYGNNVFAFCIPVPVGRESYQNISIEFFYSDKDLKKEFEGKRLFFDNEVDYLINKSTRRPEIRKLEKARSEDENRKKLFDEEKMCEVADWIHSKARFASLIASKEEFSKDIDFRNFGPVFEKIKQIITTA